MFLGSPCAYGDVTPHRDFPARRKLLHLPPPGIRKMPDQNSACCPIFLRLGPNEGDTFENGRALSQSASRTAAPQRITPASPCSDAATLARDVTHRAASSSQTGY